MTADNHETPPAPARKDKYQWLYTLLLVLILLVGAYFRLVGNDWGENQSLHPDELFLSNVETAIEPVANLGEYFDTDNSSLNPHNRGHGFFVYGTFPLFLTRYTAEWLGQTGHGQVQFVGRNLSALADLMVVLLVYLIATRLYDRRVGLVAAVFSTGVVLQIQLSHYFTVDNFINLFTYLGIYFAVLVATHGREGEADEAKPFKLEHFLLFGVALGLAAASKINSLPLALMLPAAVLLRLSRLPVDVRRRHGWNTLAYLVLAALVSVLVFRIFQPYAFSGPGFFGLRPNEKWLDNLRSLAAQQTGDVDWPPSTQWARRSIWFSFQNLALWGIGMPMAIFAWGGFIGIGWRMLKGAWRRHALLWGWVAFYFTWQSLVFNPTMRYQLPIYPGLAVFAGWGVVALWKAVSRRFQEPSWRRAAARVLAGGLGGLAVLGTLLYAYAFTHIYTRTETRVQASYWIYQNIPGPLTAPIATGEGVFNQQLSIPYNTALQLGQPLTVTFVAKQSGTLSEINLHRFTPVAHQIPLLATISPADAPDQVSLTVSASATFEADGAQSQELIFTPDTPLFLEPGVEYMLRLETQPGEAQVLVEQLELRIFEGDEQRVLTLEATSPTLSGEEPLEATFSVEAGATLAEIYLRILGEPPSLSGPLTFDLALGTTQEFDDPLSAASLTLSADQFDDSDFTFTLSQPVALQEGQFYYLRLTLSGDTTPILVLGAAPANETSWDRGLPLSVNGYDGYGGIYQRDLNFEMYWDDNEEKLDRFLSTLEASDYILISSSRQWASTTRIPERYPLTSAYYRYLLGCPAGETIEWCYNVAQVGDFEGQLGFELVQVFQSNPSIGSWEINDQFSEEAFTVYDHPKVFIFKKSADYDTEKVAALLGAVDLSSVVRLTPSQASSRSLSDLMLPPEQLAKQQAGGTWAELFPPDSPLNRSQFLAAVAWYLSMALLGLLIYPLLRYALPGLRDKGYPFARAAGLLLLAYLSWLAGSVGLSYSRTTIAVILGLLAALGIYFGYRQRHALLEEWREKRRYFLAVEIIFLTFFLAFLLVRLGNPDLWHPYKGGEKPMDLSYFNAVLKSTSFPPYDPWFAGGYINYYYFGFVYVGTLVKLLGIDTAVAYNLILPTFFAMVAVGAFSLVWNLMTVWRERRQGDGPRGWMVSPYLAGIASALMVTVLGNLGTVRMIWQGAQQLGAVGAYADTAGFLTKLMWGVRGIFQVLLGQTLPYGLGDWYWIPSRVIPAGGDVEPITEFPYFTFLYGDPHAHMIALPLTLLALAWAISVVFSRAWSEDRRWPVVGWGLLLGGVVIGSLRPTNTWDLPTYLVLGMLAVGYAVWRYYRPDGLGSRLALSPQITRMLAALGGMAVLLVLSFVLYQPYAKWYVQGYLAFDLWDRATTPNSSYFVHWGLFLFTIVTWLIWESRQWMASTPLSALGKLAPYRNLIYGALTMLGVLTAGLLLFGVGIAWLVLPLMAWVAVLFVRSGQSEAKRVVLFLIGTALFLTLMVELVVLRGDIGRMNTVFKFYLQAWVLLGVSAAAALGWVLSELRLWLPSWRGLWQIALAVLVTSAALFPLLGTAAKVRDRIAEDAPHSLDGSAYMPFATYNDQGTEFDLGQDYDAIHWMQQNVEGSPVIVEANTPEYRWGTRFTIYTGLPGVVGWNWHQRQQRAFIPSNWIPDRIEAIRLFYETEDLAEAAAFLQTYDVSYIILGQVERAYYPGPGLDKFAAGEGTLWREVYHSGDTVIYEVLDEVLADG